MTGSLNEILVEPISAENEMILKEHLKRKMRSAARLSVLLLHAMEDRFGPEARDVVHDMIDKIELAPRPNMGDPEADLREFCANLDRGCAGSHEWERVTDQPDCIAYHYSRCMWAEVYQELGEPDLGLILCAGDEPAVKSYNSRLAFKRTKVLMKGDEVCDHVFYVDKCPASGAE